jgi:CelD/BcsL family acetyltransferase involved in cellulose biosynthesis
MATLSAQIEASNRAPAVPGLGPLVVVQFNSWIELERCHAEWDQLLADIPTSSIFMTPEWLTSWWRAFGAGRQVCALAFRNSHNRMVAIAPFYLDRVLHAGFPSTTLRLVGSGSGDSDDLDFIVQPGYELAVAEAFTIWLQSGTHCDVCALETLSENSFLARHLLLIAGRRNLKTIVEELPHSFVELPRTWTAYLDTLAADFRPLLTRYPKRLHSRFKVDISRCEKLDDLDFHLQTLFTLHQLRWTGRGEPGAFADPQRRDFYARMANAFLQRGWLQFWSLTLENEIVAAQFCFRYRDTVYLLQEGFNPKYTAEKVGYALRAHVLQQMIATGARRYDFLGGADSYKARFGAKQGSYLNIYIAGPSWKGRLQLIARENSRTIKAWLKTHLPGPILALLQHRSKQQPSNG